MNLDLGTTMNDFLKYYFAVILVSVTLGGCSGGGDDGTATPPAAMPAVNAGDDQNVIEDEVVSLRAAASGFTGNPSIHLQLAQSRWPLHDF